MISVFFISIDATAQGYIVDGIGNYTLNSNCSWLIQGAPGVSINLVLEEFETECNWDYLYIYDGDSTLSPLRAAYRSVHYLKLS